MEQPETSPRPADEVYVVLEFEGDGTCEVVGVFTRPDLAVECRNRRPHRQVDTLRLDRESEFVNDEDDQ
jgi:hypothetical protein